MRPTFEEFCAFTFPFIVLYYNLILFSRHLSMLVMFLQSCFIIFFYLVGFATKTRSLYAVSILLFAWILADSRLPVIPTCSLCAYGSEDLHVRVLTYPSSTSGSDTIVWASGLPFYSDILTQDTHYPRECTEYGNGLNYTDRIMFYKHAMTTSYAWLMLLEDDAVSIYRDDTVFSRTVRSLMNYYSKQDIVWLDNRYMLHYHLTGFRGTAGILINNPEHVQRLFTFNKDMCHAIHVDAKPRDILAYLCDNQILDCVYYGIIKERETKG